MHKPTVSLVIPMFNEELNIEHAIDAAVYYGLGVSYLDEYPSLVGAVTKDEADAAFAKRVDPDRFTIVSAGSFDA